MVLHLTPNKNWYADNNRFAAYFYVDDTNNTWVDMTDEDGDGVFDLTVPEGNWAKVIFCCMNPATAENNWDNKIYQTGDLDYYKDMLYKINDRSTEADAEPEISDGEAFTYSSGLVKIYIDDQTGWGNDEMFIYTYFGSSVEVESNGKTYTQAKYEYLGAFPGVNISAIKSDENGKYIELPGNHLRYNIIFSKLRSNVRHQVYKEVSASETITIVASDVVVPANGAIYVNDQQTEKWEKVYVHAVLHNSTEYEVFGAWPGLELTKLSAEEAEAKGLTGENWWGSEFLSYGDDANPVYFTISDGSEANQTTEYFLPLDKAQYVALISTEDGTNITGIGEIEVDENAPVEYFNFQGVRMANPEKGMYIRVQAGKATKVVVE